MSHDKSRPRDEWQRLEQAIHDALQWKTEILSQVAQATRYLEELASRTDVKETTAKIKALAAGIDDWLQEIRHVLDEHRGRSPRP